MKSMLWMPMTGGPSLGFSEFGSLHEGENSTGTMKKEDLYFRCSLALDWPCELILSSEASFLTWEYLIYQENLYCQAGACGSYYYCCCSLVTKSCPTRGDPMDCSPPGSSVLGISHAGVEYWSGLPFPSPGDLSNPGIEPMSPALDRHWQMDSLPLRHQGSQPLLLPTCLFQFL